MAGESGDGPVGYELEDGVARIDLDDGKVNALSIATLTEMHSALDRADDEGALVVLRGREGTLSAGFDLATFSSGVEAVVEMLRLGATLAERILSFPRPVVVACTGHALAAGSFLPLAADMRIGVEGPFKLGLNEARIGLTVPWFAVELARHRLSPAEFDRAVGSARIYDPAAAVEAGFLDRVVPAGDLDTEIAEAVEELAGLNADAHRKTKLRVRGAALEAMRSAIESELTAEGLAGG